MFLETQQQEKDQTPNPTKPLAIRMRPQGRPLQWNSKVQSVVTKTDIKNAKDWFKKTAKGSFKNLLDARRV